MTKGIMEVTVVSASGLRRADFFGEIDAYVVIQYKNQEQTSTTAQAGQGKKLVWDEKFDFMVEYPSSLSEEVYQTYHLLLQIMDRDTFTQDDLLGQTKIYLKDLFEIGVEKGRAELPTQKYRVVSEDQTYNGEIKVGITFTAKPAGLDRS